MTRYEIELRDQLIAQVASNLISHPDALSMLGKLINFPYPDNYLDTESYVPYPDKLKLIAEVSFDFVDQLMRVRSLTPAGQASNYP